MIGENPHRKHSPILYTKKRNVPIYAYYQKEWCMNAVSD